MSDITILHKKIGMKYSPFIIAEMSGNHNQSLFTAMKIVEAAAIAGADALKIQTYTADTMTISTRSTDFVVSDKKSPWHNQSLHELYQQAYTPWEWHQAIFDRCKELGMIGFSSPFDESAVDFLETLNVPPCYKIASFECTDIPLIKKVASTKKPMIISTGMSSIAEIDETVLTAKNAGCEDIILLKCTSTYPASPMHSNLKTIPNMKEVFQCQVGLSDHTLGIGTAIASVVLGASVIEKHLTLSREDGGVDASFSLEPHELRMLVEESKSAWQAIGNVHYGPTEAEINSKSYRRSLYITEDMQKGEELTKSNLRVIRPGFGLAPKYYDVLLGKKVNKNISRGTALTWDIVE
ncbi:N-acetylneuraminate synthase [Gracilibacillus boraciitolerans JCM 21714]|uniref:N-acetylneuraminate synthase n=1 Tax=Gracilibacillus boraciitolerans JCM 21714 TaxID=1298598 RepID=W4VIT8_9BACI|nr:pseudaminic acid synthase [Gracilibacillus boraciitolerans]GAE92674.1 N-acetylneuraminate synthase [Gracilibacillus boraciitolerans JCM 21714]